MNEKLPFEEAFERQMDHVPLPDENASWQKMQELLDKKKKRRFFEFFGWYQGCAVFFIALLLGLGLLVHFSGNTGNTSSSHSSQPANNKNNTIQGSLKARQGTLGASHFPVTDITAKKNTTHPQIDRVPVTAPAPQKATERKKHNNRRGSTLLAVTNTWKTNNRSKKDIVSIKRVYKPKPEPLHPENAFNVIKIKKAEITATSSPEQKRAISAATSMNALNEQMNHPTVSSIDITYIHSDSTLKDTSAANASSLSHSKFTLSAGVGLQQQIPVFGQRPVSYGMNGHGILADYIPSIYVRFDKEHKWFMQGEFIYAAPQLIKEFSYNQSGYTDSSSGIAMSNSSNVIKTFYNQVPVNFNYYIRSNWSVGAGSIYSWFHSAITKQETTIRDIQSQAVSVTKAIIPVSANGDTSMFKPHLNLLVQTNYQWRRFSAGLRFTQDILPYIQYTKADGTRISRRNRSLGLTLRFAIWKSAKF